jgi:hypothetical protein
MNKTIFKVIKKSRLASFLAAALITAAVPALLFNNASPAAAADAAAPAAIGARGDTINTFKQMLSAYTYSATEKGINVKERGVASDGSGVLPEIQKLVDELGAKGGGTLYFPAGTYGINGDINIRSNVKLVGSGSSTTILVQKKANSALIRLDDISNTIISDMTIDQTKVVHTAGQSNHGIYAKGVNKLGIKNVLLKGPFQQSGNERGDGIYIRHSSASGDSQNVVMFNVVSEGASRNGISMVGAENVWLENITLHKFSGNINAALDLEPEAGDSVKMVTVNGLNASGENINLYTHQGTVSDILFQNVSLPKNQFYMEGNVSNVVIDASEASMMSMNGAKTDLGVPRSVFVKNSSFKALPSSSQAVYLKGGSVTFDNTEFVGGTKAAVHDVGTSGTVTIRGSIVRDSQAQGILAYKAESLQLSDNKIYNNAKNGLMLGNRKSAMKSVVLSGKNQIYNNGASGLRIELPAGSVDLTGAVVTGNREEGIFLISCKSAVIGSNSIGSNGGRGILLSDYDTSRTITNVVIKDNMINNEKGTQQYGIQVTDGPGVLKNVQITGNKIVGSLKQNLLIGPKAAIPSITAFNNILG